MKRKPRSLFKARMRGRTLYIGPEFVGPEPKYLPKLDELFRRNGHEIVPGKLNHVSIYHDDDCSIFDGGACDCEPVVKMGLPDDTPGPAS